MLLRSNAGGRAGTWVLQIVPGTFFRLHIAGRARLLWGQTKYISGAPNSVLYGHHMPASAIQKFNIVMAACMWVLHAKYRATLGTSGYCCEFASGCLRKCVPQCVDWEAIVSSLHITNEPDAESGQQLLCSFNTCEPTTNVSG